MAFWKMVGFVVTPTTCLSRMSAARVPVTSRSRDRSSSQIETPASLSCFNVSLLMAILVSVAGGRTTCCAHLGQRGVRSRDRTVGGQAELLEQDLVRRAGAEVIQSEAF